MNDYKVYRHICPNGKMYIGISRQEDIQRRWQYGWGYHNNVLFYRAIKKYGWANISHEIIYDGLTKSEAEEKEIELIAKYRSNNPKFGYNIDNGGNCFGSHSAETKRKISEAQLGEKNHMFGKTSPLKGKKHTPEQIEKNRLAHLGQLSYWKGKHLPPEMIEKMKKPKTDEHKKHLSEARSIPVICVETGEHFSSGKAAAEAKGISRGSIAHVVNGRRHTAGGYHWKLA